VSSPIRFYLDFISPYAYLGWTQIHALAKRHEREVVPVPVLFAGLLNAHGTRGPAEVPARRRYVFQDVARIALRFGVPIDLPPAHPFNPLQALRLASLPMPPASRTLLVSALFAAVWQRCRNVEDPSVLREVASSVGLPETAVDEAGSDEAKARVKAQTDEGIAAGIFGVPTMIVDGEMFWGTDSLPNLEDFLRGGGVVSSELLARWENLPASAQRRSKT
jgi:2-hydroxychromene-2-carboxylate isomerase